MKKVYVLTIFITLFTGLLLAENDISKESILNYLNGTWSWVSSCGGISGHTCYTPDSNSVPKTIVFKRIENCEDSLKYQYFQEGNLMEQGITMIKHFESDSPYEWGIGFIDAFTDNYLYLLSTIDNSLILVDECVDCFMHEFTRVGNTDSTIIVNADSIINTIIGEWDWISTCGGISGTQCITPGSIGFTNTIIIDKIAGTDDSIFYAVYKNDSVLYEGNVRISYSNSIYGKIWNFENLEGISSELLVILSNSNDTLVFGDNCEDCFSYSYVKINLVSTIIDNSLKNSFHVFPNPCSDYIKINIPDQFSSNEVLIYNITGMNVSKYLNVKDVIDVSNLRSGLYIITLTQGNETSILKFIKK